MTDVKKGPYLIIKSRIIYKSHWMEIDEDNVIKPDGKEGVFVTVDYRPGISVVALNRKYEVCLIKEYYYALEDYGFQLPSGGIEPGQTPLQAAQAELKEETGIIAKHWVELGVINPFTMFIKSPAHLFLAYGINEIGEVETGIDVIKLHFEDAFKMSLDNRITHAQSIIAIIKAKMYLDKHPKIFS